MRSQDGATPASTRRGFDDDSRGFATIERAHVRKFVPDFEWLRFAEASRRNPLPVPLNQARIALIGTAGAHLPGDPGMSPRGEIRFIPSATAEVDFTHPGFDTERAALDPEVVFPLQTLRRLVEGGFLGDVAATAISTMGFIPQGAPVLEHLVPEVVRRLRDEEVHLALLVPA